MNAAAAADDQALSRKEPAFEKIKQCKALFERLRKYELKEYLLDSDAKLLAAFARWLKPSST
jgi:hypothetical protein